MPPSLSFLTDRDALVERAVLWLVAGGLFVGIGLSLPLWLSSRAYPLVGFLPAFPAGFDAAYVVFLCLVLLCACAAPRHQRAFAAVFLVLFGLLLLQDQTRWQPWATQYVSFFVVLLLPIDRSKRLAILRFLIVAMYLWSGLQKMNAAYLHDVVPWLLDPFRSQLLLSAEAMSAVALASMAVEPLIAVLLLWVPTRRAGVLLAIALHLVILFLLGPFGQDWNAVVWPWNVALLLLVPLLFWPVTDPIRPLALARTHVVSAAVMVFVAILPALSFVGFWDSYQSFSLYSGNTDGLILSLPAEDASRFPQIPWVPLGSGAYVQASADSWSHRVIGVPSYPEERVYRGIARQLCAASQRFVFTFTFQKTLFRGPEQRFAGCDVL